MRGALANALVQSLFWKRAHLHIAPFVPILIDSKCTPECKLISPLKVQPRTFDFIATAELII